MDKQFKAILFTMTIMVTCCAFTATAKAQTQEQAQAQAAVDPLGLDVPAYVLMECGSGEVVAKKDPDKMMDMAGVTKLMSALVLAEDIAGGAFSETTECAIPKQATKASGMSAFLSPGGMYAASDLIKPMLMISANDAAISLACASAGSEEAFLQKMNDKAAQLGISPVFVNVTGHDAAGQSMSPMQAVVIARELVKHQQFLQHSAQYSDTITHKGGRVTELVNPNKLVRTYSGCDGLATGSNPTALYSGAFTAQREGQRFIAVIGGAKNSNARFDAAAKLLDYGFANFQSVTPIQEGKGVCKDVPIDGGEKKTVHGVAGASTPMLVRKGAAIQKEPRLFAPTLTAPIAKGQPIGELIVKVDGEVVQKVPITAYEEVQKASVLNSFVRAAKQYAMANMM